MKKTMSENDHNWTPFMMRLAALLNTCDHDLQHTKEVIKEFGYDVESSVAYLRSLGLSCDCSVVIYGCRERIP